MVCFDSRGVAAFEIGGDDRCESVKIWLARSKIHATGLRKSCPLLLMSPRWPGPGGMEGAAARPVGPIRRATVVNRTAAMSDIRHVIDIKASPEEVFAVVGTVAGIGRWWSTDVEGGDAVGDAVTIRFDDDWTVVMERLDSVPGERLVYRIVRHDSDEWPGTELVFELSFSEGWTTLKFSHRGWPSASDFFRFCSTKWVVFLLSIKGECESGRGTPYPDEIKIGRYG